jgi:hypothetical protein
MSVAAGIVSSADRELLSVGAKTQPHQISNDIRVTEPSNPSRQPQILNIIHFTHGKLFPTLIILIDKPLNDI